MSTKFLYILVTLVLISGFTTAVVVPQVNVPSPSSGPLVSSGVKESPLLSHPVTRSPVVQNAFVSSPVLTRNVISPDKKALSTGENVIGNGELITDFTSHLPESYEFVKKWGSSGTGDGQLHEPLGAALDSAGNVFVADTGNCRIQKFSNSGIYITQWGSRGSGDGQFQAPGGVAADSEGNVFVADTDNCRIQKFSNTGTYITKWGSCGSGDGEFQAPGGVAADSEGNVFVVDTNKYRIQKFSNTGTYITQWGSYGSGDGQFDEPFGVAVDSAGNVYVTDYFNDRIQKFSNTGTYITKWGSSGSGDGQFFRPTGVAVNSAGNVYVTEMDSNRIQKFSNTGTYITQWGSYGSGDGQFRWITGIAVDSAGNVYVADTGNNRIQKFRTSISLHSISPSSGLNSKSLSVTIYGGTFSDDVTVNLTRSGYENVTADSVLVVSPSYIICTLPLSGTAAGDWNVVVTNQNEAKGTITNGFTIIGTTPVVYYISPDAGINIGDCAVTLFGLNFNTGATVNLNRTGYADITATDTSVISSNKITCNFPISGKAAGTWNVVVKNSDQQSGGLTNGYTINNPKPTITSLSPNNEVLNTHTANYPVTVTGTNFVSGCTATLNGQNRAVTFVSSTKVTVTFLKGDDDTAGSYPVIITNPSPSVGASASLNYMVGNPAPTITSINPATGVNTRTASFTKIAGTNFRMGAKVNLTRSGQANIPGTGLTITSTKINGTFNLNRKTAGTWNVVVTNTDGQTATKTNGFTVQNPKPTLSSLSPNNEVANTHTANYPMIVTGTNFVSGCTATLKGQNRGVTYTSSTKVTVKFLKSDDDTVGSYPVVITNPSPSAGASSSITYVVGNPSTTITSINPATGVNTGTVSVTITGTNFKAGATVKLTKAGKTPITGTGVSVKSPGKLTCKLPVKGKTSGKWNVVVTNKDGQKATKKNGFTITGPVPTITAVSPKTASTTKNTSITITGTKFRSGISVKMEMGSTARTGTVKSLGSTKIVCVLPTKNAKKGTWGLKVTNSDTSSVTKTNLYVVK